MCSGAGVGRGRLRACRPCLTMCVTAHTLPSLGLHCCCTSRAGNTSLPVREGEEPWKEVSSRGRRHLCRELSLWDTGPGHGPLQFDDCRVSACCVTPCVSAVPGSGVCEQGGVQSLAGGGFTTWSAGEQRGNKGWTRPREAHQEKRLFGTGGTQPEGNLSSRL